MHTFTQMEFSDDVENLLMGIEMALSQATDTEDRSSTNLATVANIFRTIAESDAIAVSRDVLETAILIVSNIQSWGMDNSTLETLQNRSTE